MDKVIELNELAIHYREWGSAGAPPLLILHDLAGHAWEFDGVAAALAGKFRVLVPNQRGHGASGRATAYSPCAMVSDIDALADALSLQSFRLVGHGMGAVTAWMFAAENCERVERLAILDTDPPSISTFDYTRRLGAMLRRCATASFTSPEAAVAEYIESCGHSNHHGESRKFVLNNLRLGDDGRWRWKFDAARLVEWVSLVSVSEALHWSLLQRIICPSLILRAAGSAVVAHAAGDAQRPPAGSCRLRALPAHGSAGVGGTGPAEFSLNGVRVPARARPSFLRATPAPVASRRPVTVAPLLWSAGPRDTR